jgi:ribosomal protein S18 acetylase RimI-like enzyme
MAVYTAIARGLPRARSASVTYRPAIDPVALCAETTAAWHAAWLTSLGLRSDYRGAVWLALDAPPVIYWSAITVRPEASTDDLADVDGSVCDSWSKLDLSSVGFRERLREPWFVRFPRQVAEELRPPELELVRVATAAEVAEFEAVSVRGFGGEGSPVAEGAIHPPTILGDTRMTMLTGRVDGRAVAAAMSYRTEDAVGIYGVATVASARRRGYGTALTRALLEPRLPAVLSPSPEAERLYRRLGFEPVGELCQWVRR